MKKAHILLVDDDEAALEIQSVHLQNAGYQVEAASDGYEALRRLSSRKFDLIISDYIMPLMDGIQFTQYVKANHLNASTPVFMLSGHLNNQVISTFSQLGVVRFLTKPCNPEELLKAIYNQVQPPSQITNYSHECILMFQQTILDTFGQYFDTDVSIADSELIRSSSAICHYSSSIPFFGRSLFGYSSLYSDRATLRSICQKAFGTGESDFGETTYLDILGELSNQVVGRFKQIVEDKGIDIIIGLPVTLAGYPKNLSLLPAFPRIFFDITIGGHKIFVEYCVSDPAKVEHMRDNSDFTIFTYEGNDR